MAVQAVSEHIYATLVPGITNVTDRARCYTFYPWFVWAFDQESRSRNVNEFTRLLRRAECLHTLIGIAHELDRSDEWSHGGQLVGRDTLVDVAKTVLSGHATRLSRYAGLEADLADRYFKHRLGGLGQYYLGPLKKDLEVLAGDSKQGINYTAEWGVALAQLYDKKVDRKAFFQVLRDDRIDIAVLRSLTAFCPCRLRKNDQERLRLLDLLFCRGEGDLKQDFGQERRKTLLLLLDYAERVRGKALILTPESVIDAAYTRYLPDGTAWVVAPLLADIQREWGIYSRHELLAIAVQGLFWAALAALADDGGFVTDITAYAKWFEAQFSASVARLFGKSSFATAVDQYKTTYLQPMSDIQRPDHEVSLAQAAWDAQWQSNYDVVVDRCIRLLVCLVARGYEPAHYGKLDFPEHFLTTYEINLVSLERFATSEWAAMNASEWLRWLAVNWGIRVHFRVALRKLRHQMQDSFRIVPLEEGLRVREAPQMRWSSPRLWQALRFLCDLGLLDYTQRDEKSGYVLNDLGKEFLEAELGRA